MDADKIGQLVVGSRHKVRVRQGLTILLTRQRTRGLQKRRQSYARLENISHQRKFQHTFSDPNHLILILLVKTKLKWWTGEWWGSKSVGKLLGTLKVIHDEENKKYYMMIIPFLIRKFVFQFQRRSHFYLVRKCFNYIVNQRITGGYPSLSTIAILLQLNLPVNIINM